jgi:YrbI family 3-deoxy-D-manno-octulosonate 8-phosphate phosphatase
MSVNSKALTLESVDAVVFDFDGVLTDNRVIVDQNGKESVICSRSDGLAFDALRVLEFPVFIISTESNPVVQARAKKLQVPVIQSVANKVRSLGQLCEKEGLEMSKILFVGNDLNDYNVMRLSGYSACPSDAHEKIKDISTFVLNEKGGFGVAREILEKVLNVNLLQTLYNSD